MPHLLNKNLPRFETFNFPPTVQQRLKNLKSQLSKNFTSTGIGKRRISNSQKESIANDLFSTRFDAIEAVLLEQVKPPKSSTLSFFLKNRANTKTPGATTVNKFNSQSEFLFGKEAQLSNLGSAGSGLINLTSFFPGGNIFSPFLSGPKKFFDRAATDPRGLIKESRTEILRQQAEQNNFDNAQLTLTEESGKIANEEQKARQSKDLAEKSLIDRFKGIFGTTPEENFENLLKDQALLEQALINEQLAGQLAVSPSTQQIALPTNFPSAGNLFGGLEGSLKTGGVILLAIGGFIILTNLSKKSRR